MLRTRTTAALAAVAALAAGGTALAADSGSTETPTAVTVSSAPTLQAGAIAPFDAPGVKAIRRGQAIPSGYELVGYRIQVHRGTRLAGAALRFACPGGKTLRSFGIVGHAGFSADRDYSHHKVTWVTSTPDGRLADADGLLYAICR